MPSQTVVADYVFTWNNETLKLIFDWYFNSWGYIPSIFDHLPCFYKHFKHWLCDTRLYIEDKEKKSMFDFAEFTGISHNESLSEFTLVEPMLD